MGRQQNRQRQRRVQRRQDIRRQQETAHRTGFHFNRFATGLGALIVLAAIGIFIYAATRPASNTPVAPPTPTSSVSAAAAAVNGVQCNTNENLAYHIHQHITLYDHGKQVALSSEIGIPGGELQAKCFYWIHVHQSTPNIIHVESPTKRIYKLGTFFGIWKATKASTIPPGDAYVQKLQAAAFKGQVTTYLNGKVWKGGYATVPLKEHAVITLEIGKPLVSPKPFNQWGNL